MKEMCAHLGTSVGCGVVRRRLRADREARPTRAQLGRAGCAPGWARPADLKIDCKYLFLDERLAHYLILASLVNEMGGVGYGERGKTVVRKS